MSNEGWEQFNAAAGLDDWVVLHGGATAVFKVDGLQAAARLTKAVADLAGSAPGTLITVASDAVTVRLTRDLWQIEPAHIDLARGISDAAHEHHAIADRGRAQEVQVAVAGRRDDLDVGFWRAALGYSPAADDNAVDPLGHGSTLWMQELDEPTSLRHAMHIDVSVARDEVEGRLRAALDAGGRVVDDSQAPMWWTLADRAGNRVCIAAWPDGATTDQAE